MELKPCPFCGSDRVYYTVTEEQNYPDHVEGFIRCHGCGFSSDVFLDPEIAAEKWNRRAKWISVEEKLAEWPCIVYDAHGNLPSIPYGILTVTDAQGTWQIDARLADSALHQGKAKPVLGYGNRITHWMPLPEPPKEET